MTIVEESSQEQGRGQRANILKNEGRYEDTNVRT